MPRQHPRGDLPVRSVMEKLSSPILHFSGAYRRRWARPENRHTAIALMYHRIAAAGGHGEPAGFGVECGVPVDVFEAQLRFLLRYFRAARAADLALRPESCDGPAFAVTFDDGYADNLHLAAPVLERHGVPATVFVNSGFVGTDRRFWWEQLGALLRETRASALAPRAIDPVLGERWELPESLPLRGARDRERAHWLLSQALMRTPAAEIDPLLQRLAAALAVPLRVGARDAPLLDWDQVRELRGRGFDIGSHGHTHANLGLVDAELAEREIRASVEQISAEIDAPVEIFAYPYGGPEHRCSASVEAVQRAGLEAAFTTELGAFTPEADRFALPRLGFTRPQGFVCAYHTDRAFRAGRTATVAA